MVRKRNGIIKSVCQGYPLLPIYLSILLFSLPKVLEKRLDGI